MEVISKLLILHALIGNIVKTVTVQNCPEGNLWRLRAKVECADEKSYHCLYDTFNEKIIEKCLPPKRYKKGLRIVISGNLDAKPCHISRFSPYSVLSNEGPNCPYIKSLCSDEGQLNANNDTTESDRSCRCDFSKGYDYVIKPLDPCQCSPAKEDCSCYQTHCENSFSIASQDYECTSRRSFNGNFSCQPIKNFRDEEISTIRIVSMEKNVSVSLLGSEKKPVAVVLLVAVLIMLVVVPTACFYYGTKPHFLSCVQRNDEKGPPVILVDQTMYYITSGQSVTLRCVIKGACAKVYWKFGPKGKRSDINTLFVNRYSRPTRKSPSLCINNTSSLDSGVYVCIVTSKYGEKESQEITLIVADSTEEMKICHQDDDMLVVNSFYETKHVEEVKAVFDSGYRFIILTGYFVTLRKELFFQ